ncbi:MAG TPA: hypothetical protein VM509_02550, partial [Planctomycetota bacterium]|nr:hypothetical protein [Planctomycetota bacterium]
MLILAILALATSEPWQRPGAPPPKNPPEASPPKSPYVPGKRGARDADDDSGPAVLAEDAVAQEEGVAGKVPPLARRVEWALPSLDADTIGRPRVELAGLAADAQGFCVLQGDDRDGSRNYVLLPLDVDLAPRGPALRIDDRASGRGQTDAAIAPAGSGKLALAWLDVEDESNRLRGRAWDAQGGSELWTMPLPIDRRTAEERPTLPGRALPRLEPALLAGEASWTVAVQVGGYVVLRELDPRTGAKLAENVLGSRNQYAVSGPRLARDTTGATACAQETNRGVMLFLRLGAELTANCDLGPGTLFGLAGDPHSPEGGWWLLIRFQGRLLLRHLERSGAPDRPELELSTRPIANAQLAVGPRGACVLAQYARGGLDALWIDSASPEPSVNATELRSADRPVIAASLAFRDELCAFAWTERSGTRVELVACTASASAHALGA